MNLQYRVVVRPLQAGYIHQITSSTSHLAPNMYLGVENKYIVKFIHHTSYKSCLPIVSMSHTLESTHTRSNPTGRNRHIKMAKASLKSSSLNPQLRLLESVEIP